MNGGRWPIAFPGSGRRIFISISAFSWSVLSLFILSGCATALHTAVSKQALADATAEMHERDYDKAASSLKEALRWNPGDPEIWYHMGRVSLTLEDYDGAESAFRECLRRDPTYGDAQAGLWAVRLLRQGYTPEVRDAVRAEIDTYVQNLSGDTPATTWMGPYQGRVYLHDTEGAWDLLPKIMASGPEADLRKDLSQAAAEDILLERDVQKKISMIERHLSLFPPGLWRNLAFGFLLKIAADDLNDLDKLQEYGERWTGEEPENRIAHASAGYWYTEKGVALEKAVEHLRKALKLIRTPSLTDKPDHYPEDLWRSDLQLTEGRYHDLLGWVLYQLNRPEEAEKELREATGFLDFEERLYRHLGRVLEQKGDREGAISAYLRSAEAGGNPPEVEEALRNLLCQPGGDPDRCPMSPEPLYSYFAHRSGITHFTDVTDAAGLSGIPGRRVAWGDYDNDGFADLLLEGRILMRNQGDGTFADVTEESGIPEIPGANGGVWADFNNDGNLDLYIFASGEGTRDRFLQNRGDGTFEDVTERAVTEPDGDPTEAAAWGDYDGDGHVDLYVANYERPLAATIERAIGTADRLYRNNGDGTFTEVSRTAGVVSPEKMAGRGVNWGDYNNDGFPDIFVSNYRLDPNFLWRNNGNGTFTEVGKEVGVAGNEVEGYFGHTIGSAWGDYDNDGDLDLFSANLAHPRDIGISNKSMLLENLGPPDFRFADRFRRSGIRYEETHADPTFLDYDKDGFLDLYITSTYGGKHSHLYRGRGDGTFADVTYLAGVRVDNGWGSAFADMDHDGDLDLAVGTGQGIRLFRNEGNVSSWLQVRVIGDSSNRSGIGSRVKVIAGTSSQIREVEGGKGTGNQHDLPAVFGFGAYQGTVDLEVRFPSGKVVCGKRLDVNQRLRVEEGTAQISIDEPR